MNRSKAAALIVTGIVFACAIGAMPASAEASFDFFYSNLSPHGRWLVSGSYGKVWQPSDYQPGWDPYYDGHWEYTDVGYTWVSDYPWGAVPYHYGTWARDPGYGWVWVPGYTWAPAWVVFRTGPDYIGWAPVTPSFSVGVSFGIGDYDQGHFVFVPSRQFFAPRVRTFVVPPSRTTVIVNRTKIINNNIRIENNIVVNRGPSIAEMRRVTGRPLHAVPLEKVRGLGPAVRREEIRVDARQARHGLRAAEPVKDRGRVAREGARSESRIGDRDAEPRAEAGSGRRIAVQDQSGSSASHLDARRTARREDAHPAHEGAFDPDASRAPERRKDVKAGRAGDPPEASRPGDPVRRPQDREKGNKPRGGKKETEKAQPETAGR